MISESVKKIIQKVRTGDGVISRQEIIELCDSIENLKEQLGDFHSQANAFQDLTKSLEVARIKINQRLSDFNKSHKNKP